MITGGAVWCYISDLSLTKPIQKVWSEWRKVLPIDHPCSVLCNQPKRIILGCVSCFNFINMWEVYINVFCCIRFGYWYGGNKPKSFWVMLLQSKYYTLCLGWEYAAQIFRFNGRKYRCRSFFSHTLSLVEKIFQSWLRKLCPCVQNGKRIEVRRW